MSTQPFEQKCFYTVDEFAALPEDNSMRYELIDGRIVASPRPGLPHMGVLYELGWAIRSQLPPTLRLFAEIDLDLELSSPVVRIPDIVVLHTRGVRSRGLTKATDIVLAVEIISPGSRRTDTTIKLLQYADAGIPHLWLVDPIRPVTATTYRLRNGEYEESQRAVHELRVDEPCPLRIDLDALLYPEFE